MKKFIQFELKENETTELTDFIGFTLTDKSKGYLVYCGENNCLRAVLAIEPPGLGYPNSSWGNAIENKYTSIEDFVENCKNHNHRNIKDIYCFASLKELHRWLSE